MELTSDVPLCVLPDGYWRVPQGKLANATVWMEMRRAPQTAGTSIALRGVPAANNSGVRSAFNRIGASYLWDRAAQLNQDILRDPWTADDFLYFAYDNDDRHVGLLELARRGHDSGRIEVEISYLGLFPEFIGRGLGKQLMAVALQVAWDFAPTRVFLHTCNTDHPAAYAFYLAGGFTPYAAGFQLMDDPRLQGLFPKMSAPHVPLIDA